MTPAAPDPGPHWPGWLGAALKGMVLIGGLFALGGALTLFAIGLLANGRGHANAYSSVAQANHCARYVNRGPTSTSPAR